MLRATFLGLTGISVFLADQLVKVFLVNFLKPSESIPVIKGIFHITLVYNTGCAFGLFRDQPAAVFLLVSSAVAIYLVYILSRLKGRHLLYELAAVLLLAGSISNTLDRLRLGHVVDYLDFRIWPVFNLGDTAITIGVILFGYSLLMSKDVQRNFGIDK